MGLTAMQLAELMEAREIPIPAPLRPIETDVRVYVMIDADNAVKVGISKHPHYRAETLSRERRGIVRLYWQSPPYERAAAYTLEQRTHAQLAPHRINGEWFSCAPESAVSAVINIGEIS